MKLLRHQENSSLVIISSILMTFVCFNRTDLMRRNLMLITIGAFRVNRPQYYEYCISVVVTESIEITVIGGGMMT